MKLKMRAEGAGSDRAETVVELFERIVVGYGEHVALKAKRGGEWRNWTYRAYFEESSVVAKAFIEVRTPRRYGQLKNHLPPAQLGLEPYHAVCILGFNSPEWHIAYMGAVMAWWVRGAGQSIERVILSPHAAGFRWECTPAVPRRHATP